MLVISYCLVHVSPPLISGELLLGFQFRTDSLELSLPSNRVYKCLNMKKKIEKVKSMSTIKRNRVQKMRYACMTSDISHDVVSSASQRRTDTTHRRIEFKPKAS